MKNLPIHDKDGPIGSLNLSAEGLYTRFTARLPGRPGLWRLWLIGEGRLPLGIMEPGKEQLRLSRRLSKKELSKIKDPERALLLPIDESPPVGAGVPTALVPHCTISGFKCMGGFKTARLRGREEQGFAAVPS